MFRIGNSYFQRKVRRYLISNVPGHTISYQYAVINAVLKINGLKPLSNFYFCSSQKNRVEKSELDSILNQRIKIKVGRYKRGNRNVASSF